MPTANAAGSAARADIGVFIGRFQPFHNGHLHVVTTALKRCAHLTILVGSSGKPRDYFNPFSFAERRDMIMAAIPPVDRSRVFVQPLFDMTYNDGAWVKQVQERVLGAKSHFDLPNATTGLVGHRKDGTSFYLNMFPSYAEIAVENHRGVSATPLREKYFLSDEGVDGICLSIPETTRAFLDVFTGTEDYRNIRDEYEYVRKYKSQFEGLSYPPIFQTVDAVVVQSGHVLLIKRKSRPGKSLWALPGGFLNANERVQDAVYRELREETKIKVPEPVLRGSTVTNRLFDDVHRSARGRTLTHAFLIKLPDGPLSPVKGADDAEKARWIPLAELRADTLFEDHFAIITNLTALI